jgi:hypothetical protein
MTAKKSQQRYRVVRAFMHEGVYYSGSENTEVSKLPDKVRTERIEGGYLEALDAPAAEPAPADKAKE